MTKYAKLNKLKGRITERETSYRKISKETGIPLNTLCNKLNGRGIFDIVEVSKICSFLAIPAEEIPIFFLPCCETQEKHQAM